MEQAAGVNKGQYLGALVCFFVLRSKVDQQLEKMKELQATIKNVEEVAKQIADQR
jgi:hypothetical protein